MKEKLETIKAALEFYSKFQENTEDGVYYKQDAHYAGAFPNDEGEQATNALTTLKSLQADIASEEMVEKVRIAIQHSDVQVATTGYKTVMSSTIAQAAAIAAINAILGN